MQEQLDTLHKTNTWDMVDLPPRKIAIGCGCVQKVKIRSDGSIERYKARFVGKGCNQEYGIDFENTCALVARLTSVRSLIAVVAGKNWGLFLMDVKNAFLNGDLDEEE